MMGAGEVAGPKPQVINVKIYGQEYGVRGMEAPEYIKKLAEEVDGKINQLHLMYPGIPPIKLAVLTALNLADELHKLREDYETIMQLIEEEKRI